jgi:hypothetical protein
MVCGQEKFPSRSCGQSASSGRPTEPTSAVGRSKPRGRSLANALAQRFRRRQAPISVLHRAISKPWAPFSATFATLSFLRSRARSAARPLRHLVGSRLPGPYHFRARIQSFQPVAAPFPGDSVLGPLAPRFRRPQRLCSKTDDLPGDFRREGAVRTNIERLRDSGKKFVERAVGLFELPFCAQFCQRRFSRADISCNASPHCLRRPRTKDPR